MVSFLHLTNPRRHTSPSLPRLATACMRLSRQPTCLCLPWSFSTFSSRGSPSLCARRVSVLGSCLSSHDPTKAVLLHPPAPLLTVMRSLDLCSSMHSRPRLVAPRTSPPSFVQLIVIIYGYAKFDISFPHRSGVAEARTGTGGRQGQWPQTERDLFPQFHSKLFAVWDGQEVKCRNDEYSSINQGAVHGHAVE